VALDLRFHVSLACMELKLSSVEGDKMYWTMHVKVYGKMASQRMESR
jgi:hypothetical protein